MMINKRLIGSVSESKPYIAKNIALQWCALAANMVMIGSICRLLERLEGFCSENDWQRAYNEINEFERELTDWGAVVIKFWVQIDKQTQLLRFNERQNDPAKQWKITEEDWRNREKWDAYETAVNEMLQKTSTANAPWHILESVDKKYARIKALQITADALEKALR